MEKIKVFLSDPQILFREGMHFTLSGEDDFEVTGEATNNEEAFTFLETNPPNVAVLNMKDGKLDGPAMTCRIKRNLPDISVILITDSENEEHIFSALKSGASAYLTKSVDPEYLIDIIRAVAQGSKPIVEALLTQGLASRVLVEFEGLATLSEELNNLLAHLSPEETGILSSITAGNDLEQVATKLEINEDTIRRNLRSILNKLIANNQSRAVVEATQRSLPCLVSGAVPGVIPSADYVTRDELKEFKDSLTQRLKSLIGELD